MENLLKKLQRIFETKIDNGQNLEQFIDRLPKNGLTKEKIIDGIFFQIGKTI